MEMFDTTKEQPISLADAADLLPKKPSGKKVSIRTIERWIRFGHHGVKLEGGKFGDSLCTSRESLQRFSVRLMEQDRVEKGEPKPPPRTPTEARQAHTKAKRDLEKSGWGSAGKPKRQTPAKASV